MCLSCGCGQTQENHGINDHSTMRGLEEAARTSKISVEEAAENIQKGAREAAKR